MPWEFVAVTNTLYPQRLALSSPASGGRSVGVVRLRTTATEFFFNVCGIDNRLRALFITGLYILSAPKRYKLHNMTVRLMVETTSTRLHDSESYAGGSVSFL
jgi:hypothetical protein